MKLADVYGDGRFGLSFRTLSNQKPKLAKERFTRMLKNLSTLGPSFITCTYGAGGSTQTKTLEIIGEVKKRFDLPVASHLTCVGSTQDQLKDYLAQAKGQGVDYIVALRGDPPKGET